MNARDENADRNYRRFLEYFRKGWLRPDLFPKKMSNEVFGKLNVLTGKYGCKIRIGIYADNYFFFEYNKKNIKEIREDIKNGV